MDTGSNNKPADAIRDAIEKTVAADLIRRAIEQAAAEGRDFISCADFQSCPDFPGCCASCHEDEEFDGLIYNLWNDEVAPIFQGKQTHFCCTVMKWISALAEAARF